MALSRRLRFEILRRDNHTCRYCGRSAPEVRLHVDHVTPVALGGNDDPSNLATSCEDCNGGKSSMAPDQKIVDDVSEDALRWSKAMADVAEIRTREQRDNAEIWDWFNEIWCRWTDWRGDPLPADESGGYGMTIQKFLAAGLTKSEIEHLVHVAMGAKHINNKQKWKYFCGCCWRRIRENQEIAAQIIKAQEEEPNG